MLNRFFFLLLISIISVFTFAGCEIVEGIFKAGFWVGVILVILIIAAVMAILRKIKK